MRAGEAISSEKIPPHRLSTAARRLRQEGVEVASRKIILNPGGFPAQIRAEYQVVKPSHNNGNGSNGNGSNENKPIAAIEHVSIGSNGDSLIRPEDDPRPTWGSVTAQIRERLINGEGLTVARCMADYGCSKSRLGQVAIGMRREGYAVEVLKEPGNRPGTYLITKMPVRRSRPQGKKVTKTPKWVREAEAEEEAGIVHEMPRLKELVTRQTDSMLPRRHPTLGSTVCGVELTEEGAIRLKIRDGSNYHFATLEG